MSKSEKRMQRPEMWEYFKALKVPADKIGRKKGDTDKAKKHIKYQCIVNGDRLIIGQWSSLGQIDSKVQKNGKRKYFKSPDADFIGVYYMTPGGGTNVSTNGKDWNSGKVCYLAIGGWNYWTAYSTYGYSYECVGGEAEALSWIRDHWGECSWYHEYRNDDLLDKLERVEEHISWQRRLNSEQRRKKKWSDYAATLPDLPADFEAWAREVAYGDLEYAFGEKDSDKYFCTACGKMHTNKTWKHRGRYECSRTGKKIKVEKVEKNGIERRERLMIVQSHKTIDGEICSVVRHFTSWCTWSRSGSTFRFSPDAILVLRLDGSTVYGDDIIYNLRPDEWDVRNPCGYQHKRCYCYPDVSALAGTAYGNIGIDAAAAKGWKLHYNNLMRGWYDDSRMEYLIKGNFRQLVDDMTSCEGHSVSLFIGNTVKEVLGIDGQGVARLRQNDGGVYYLDWLRAVYMSYGISRGKDGLKVIHGKISEAALNFFVEKKITPTEVAFALNLGMSPEQIMNYLGKDHGYKRSDCSWLGNKEHVVIRQWSDYIEMAKKLKLDLSKESVYKPKYLRGKHDELTELINAEKAKLEAERIESEYPAIKPVCAKIKELYEWGDGEYEVIVPEGAAAIQREGRLLRHCVGTTDRYFDRIAEEESYIMFLRKADRRDAPWYTMEVEPGGAVRQLRTYGDDEGSDRAEAKAFLKKWRAEISKRLGQAEHEAAEVSREKRLREFEELRRNGNIIRNGKLAGKLLVEVLEADFREYNEEAV